MADDANIVADLDVIVNFVSESDGDSKTIVVDLVDIEDYLNES